MSHITDPTSAPLLVGRERELAILRQHLDVALAGHGSLVLIGGEAGIGKTALAETLCRDAEEQGALVLIGRCFDLTETPPYGPWLELFGQYHREEAMPPLLAAFTDGGTVGEVSNQATLFQQVRDFFTVLVARQPTVLLFDDLHWADPASLDLLRAVARQLVRWPLLVVVTYRSEAVDAPNPLDALIPTLVREAPTERLDLRALRDDVVHALVDRRYGLPLEDSTRLSRYVQQRAEGNPFFVGEVLRTLQEEAVLHQGAGGWLLDDLVDVGVPALVRQVIDGRLNRLDDETRRLLAIAAVIGQKVPYTLWGMVAEASEESLLAVVERAEGARAMEETTDGMAARFTHALIREALYEGGRPSRRRGWHRRAGEALLTMPQPDPDTVAYHFERAGDPRAFAWLVRAGLRAWRAAAWLTAAARFTAAAALPDEDGSRAGARGWLHFASGTRLVHSDNVQGLRALDAAEPLAIAANDRALAAYIRIHRSQQFFVSGQIRRALAEMERGLAELDVLPDAFRLRIGTEVALEQIAALLPDGEGAVLVSPQARAVPTVGLYGAYVAHWRTQSGRYREGLALCEAFIAALATTPDGERLNWGRPAQLGLGHAHAALGHPEAARRAYALSCAAGYATHNAHIVGITLWCELLYVVLPYQADDPTERTRLVAEAATAWERERGTITETLHDNPTDLFPALVEGRWADADRLARATLASATVARVQGAIEVLGVLAWYRGEPDRAWEQVRALHPAGPGTEPGDCFFVHGIALQALAAELALDAGNPAAAAAWIAAHGRWLDWSGATLWRAEHLLLQARHARVSGEWGRAWEHTEAALQQASEPRQPLRLLAAHRLLGELATDARRSADADRHLRESLTLAEACGAPYERALTLLAYAELRAVTGETADARTLLEDVRTICVPLGATPALARADALADRLVDAVPMPAIYPAGLSAREVDVLRLVAQGLSNREIAAALFISSRTVNRHIENLYRKIAARNKADATAYALRHNLT